MPLRLGPDDDLAAAVQPGAEILLAPGRYAQPIVIASGPVTIRAAEPGVEFVQAGIEVRGASDVRIEGVTFLLAPECAIGVYGPSRGVAIERCTFLACGQSTVTVWLGIGVHDASIRNCLLDRRGAEGPHHLKPGHVHSIGIMCAQVEATGHAILTNRIINYGYGVQLGTTGTCRLEGRHRVEGNTIDHPLVDGIHVKQARCRVLANTVIGARNKAMSSRAGLASVFSDNRIEDALLGIEIRGADHELTGNEIVRARRAAVELCEAKTNGDGFAAQNTRVEGNRFVECGGADHYPDAPPACGGILLRTDRPQRLGLNETLGPNPPVVGHIGTHAPEPGPGR